MRGDNQLINVLMKDGTPRRVARTEAERMLSGGAAKRYISNTVYRALKLGIEVKDPGTRDKNGKLRAAIKDAQAKTASAHKAEQKKKKAAEKEAAKHREAQEVLNDESI